MKNIRVLVVEDEPIIAADLEDRLTGMGYEVAQQCSTGESAIQFLEKQQVDLILMDIQLDGLLDGIETARKILETQSTPIIYLTSNVDDAHFNRAKDTRPAAYLSKPFRGKDLQHAIELAISRLATVMPPDNIPAPPVESTSFLLQDRIFIKVKDRMVRLFIHDILWLEADDYYCKLKTQDKEYLIGQTLKQMGEALANSPEFMRVHRSFIVNLTHVEEIGELFLSIGKREIPLNKASKDEIITRIQRI